MKKELNTIRAFLVRDALMAMSYRLSFGMELLSVFVTIISLYFMSRLVGHHPSVDKYGGYLAFSVIGFAMVSYLTTGFTSFSSAIRSEQMMGTLESVLMTTARLPVIIIASSIWNFLWATMMAVAVIVAASLLFDIQIRGSVAGAGLLLLLTTLTFSCLGVVSASFTMVFKRGDPLRFFVGTISFLLGGVAYPVSELPSWLQKLSKLLPITHGLAGMRDLLLAGRPFKDVLPTVYILLLFSAVGVPVSYFCFKKAIAIARREGSLLHY